jgi:AraC family ethanolamine operon transcriptional activator
LVEPETLREAASVLLRRDLDVVMPRQLAINPPPTVLGNLNEEIRRTFEVCSALPPSEMDENLLERLRSRCLVALCRVFEGDDRPARISLPPGDRLEVVRQAEALMEHHRVRPLSALALCKALCVSRRTLFYAFQDVFGMTPMAYYKIKRLHAVRQELKAVDRDAASVGLISRKHGFYHAGQFAQDYLRQFGERPSDTLNRFRGATGRVSG